MRVEKRPPPTLVKDEAKSMMKDDHLYLEWRKEQVLFNEGYKRLPKITKIEHCGKEFTIDILDVTDEAVSIICPYCDKVVLTWGSPSS